VRPLFFSNYQSACSREKAKRPSAKREILLLIVEKRRIVPPYIAQFHLHVVREYALALRSSASELRGAKGAQSLLTLALSAGAAEGQRRIAGHSGKRNVIASCAQSYTGAYRGCRL
jgi:hypothetical protein